MVGDLMPAPTTTKAIRVAIDLQTIDVLGSVESVLDSLRSDTEFTLSSAEVHRVTATVSASTVTLWDTSTSVIADIAKGVIIAYGGSVTIEITDGANVSNRKLDVGWPMFLSADAGITLLRVTGTGTVKCWIWEA